MENTLFVPDILKDIGTIVEISAGLLKTGANNLTILNEACKTPVLVVGNCAYVGREEIREYIENRKTHKTHYTKGH